MASCLPRPSKYGGANHEPDPRCSLLLQRSNYRNAFLVEARGGQMQIDALGDADVSREKPEGLEEFV